MSALDSTGAPVQSVQPRRRAGRDAWRMLRRSPTGLAGLVLVGAIVLLCLASASGLLPHDPLAQEAAQRMSPPSAEHWFGTDRFGRDVFARVAAGVANSARIALVAVAFSTIAGTIGGIVAGYLRGAPDAAVSGITNVLFAFPPLLLALTLASVFARTWFTIAVAIAIVYTPIFIRVTRGPVLTLREIDFVRAARATGQSSAAIMARHILPNIASIVIVQVTLSLSWAVLTEASLSFLGLGTPPPAPSLGSMVYEARTLVALAPWTMVFPGLVMVVLVVGLNLLGDGVRDALDPQSRGKR
ncbi:MAG: ABC transporter permease [Propionibacteriaceae bacterium]|jgi:peptide/nickel transport system permease protein|nr:ABC transporter permease [Propionibacteriaceae bacterium]